MTELGWRLGSIRMTSERRALTASNRRWRKVAWISSRLVALLSLLGMGWPVLGYVSDRVRRDDEGVVAHVSPVRARAVGADDTPVLRIVSVSPPRTIEVIEEDDAYLWVGYSDLEIEIPRAECYISESDLLAVISALATGKYTAGIPRPRLWQKVRVTVAGDAGTTWIFSGRRAR
ncbi:hypothetical protein EXU48_03410 [Occultella glacieicola]|uniref:FtsQ-type POTRA domain-containing protein n=1 Tax=Occultella glacieicola TaxID=2518684 RepID=A0ABY2EBR8_9MICO|nr:hypothetical protein [Occultella glacieicola]TDE97269.1 hypothetical protein EXU48_03410 [Occultella glacieicola]